MSCKDVLIQNLSTTKMTALSQVAYLNTIDQTTFNQDRNSVTGAATFLGDFGFVDGNTTWATFSQLLTTYNQKNSYAYTSDQWLSLYSANLNDAQVTAWQACVTAQANAQNGSLGSTVKYWDNNLVIVAISFTPDLQNAQTQYNLTWVPTNGQLQPQYHVPATISGAQGPVNLVLGFDRSPRDTEFTLTIQVGQQYTTIVSLPYIGTIAPPKRMYPIPLTFNVTSTHADTTLYLNDQADFTGASVGLLVLNSGRKYVSTSAKQFQVTLDVYSSLAAIEVQYGDTPVVTPVPVQFNSALASFTLAMDNTYHALPGLP